MILLNVECGVLANNNASSIYERLVNVRTLVPLLLLLGLPVAALVREQVLAAVL